MTFIFVPDFFDFQTVGKRGKTSVADGPKKKKPCVVNKKYLCHVCGTEITHLNRHLHLEHGVPLKEANILGKSASNVKLKKAPTSSKPRPHRLCPLPGCSVRTTNMTRHLKSQQHASVITDDKVQILPLRINT